MGLLSGLLGEASEVDIEAVERDFAEMLIDGEQIERAFKVIRDLVVFTNKRLILVDKQGLTANKVEYHSVPYRTITRFSIETSGRFDMDAELKVYVSGSSSPIQRSSRRIRTSTVFRKRWPPTCSSEPRRAGPSSRS